MIDLTVLSVELFRAQPQLSLTPSTEPSLYLVNSITLYVYSYVHFHLCFTSFTMCSDAQKFELDVSESYLASNCRKPTIHFPKARLCRCGSLPQKSCNSNHFMLPYTKFNIVSKAAIHNVSLVNFFVSPMRNKWHYTCS